MRVALTVVPFVVFSARHLVNSSITSETHSEVRPACTLSYCRILLRTDPHRNLMWNWDIAGASEGDANVP